MLNCNSKHTFWYFSSCIEDKNQQNVNMMKLIQGDAYNDNEKYYHSVCLMIWYKIQSGNGRGSGSYTPILLTLQGS